MKSVTVRLDDETLEKARVKAAERNISLSRFIGEVLGRDLRHETEYEAAYRAWHAAKPFPLSGPQEPYPKREELYDRAAMRFRHAGGSQPVQLRCRGAAAADRRRPADGRRPAPGAENGTDGDRRTA